ncbi:uncharacterized protein OCT59_012446 [Rhizophagus irregularis]|uniref:uncharacterized protein n=1 Tax=Rhizophagus irregularis TaxID=588596 RepID=UPI003317F2D4|nr:hypothetical protein OCT59_012446 [Rhizophagus irregularis]
MPGYLSFDQHVLNEFTNFTNNEKIIAFFFLVMKSFINKQQIIECRCFVPKKLAQITMKVDAQSIEYFNVKPWPKSFTNFHC